MKRKVIEISPRTFALTLPAEFVKSYNIQKGDSLNVSQLEHSLLISKSEPLIYFAEPSIWNTYSNKMKIKMVRYLLQNGFERIIIPYDEVVVFFLKEMRNCEIIEEPKRVIILSRKTDSTKNLLSSLSHLMVVLKGILSFNFDFRLLVQTASSLSEISLKELLDECKNDFNRFFTVLNIINSSKSLTLFLKMNSGEIFISEVVNDLIRIMALFRSYLLKKTDFDEFFLRFSKILKHSSRIIDNSKSKIVNVKTMKIDVLDGNKEAKAYHKNMLSRVQIII